MAANEYRFIEYWIFPGYAPDEVWEVMADARLLPMWWRGVYLEAEPMGEWTGPVVGGRMRVKARGFLPYTLNFMLEATALEPGKVLETKTHSDFEGVWRGEFSAIPDGTRVDINWCVTVNKPVVRLLSPVLRPLFAWNHNWTTPRGETGMRAYLASHRPKSTAQSS